MSRLPDRTLSQMRRFYIIENKELSPYEKFQSLKKYVFFPVKQTMWQTIRDLMIDVLFMQSLPVRSRTVRAYYDRLWRLEHSDKNDLVGPFYREQIGQTTLFEARK